MSIFAWPFGDQIDAFEMRVASNTEVFSSPYSKTPYIEDNLGEKWMITVGLPSRVEDQQGLMREAFFDRMQGPLNLVTMWHLKRPAPLGTLSNSATLHADIPQLSNVGSLNCPTGTTLFAGDMFSINGQLVRSMITTVSAGNVMPIEFLPRARTLLAAAGSAINVNRPAANFMLLSDKIPTTWRQGYFDATAIDLMEVF